MALQWTLKLNDAFSGPIRKAGASAKSFASDAKTAAASAGAVDKALARMRPSGLSTLPGQAQRGTGALDRLRGAAERFGVSGFTPSVGGASRALGGFAMAAGAATMASAALVGGLAVKGFGLVRDAQKFRESTMFAFERITQSKAGAEAAMAMASKTALMVGAPLEDAVGSIQKLMARGFDVRSADELTRSFYDLQRVNPSANIDNITNAIAQIRGKGTLKKEELQSQLGEYMNVSNVMDGLGKKLGLKTRDAVDKAMASGKISADVGIAAIMDEINRSSGNKGKAGATSAAGTANIEGAIQRMKTLGQMKMGEIKTDYSPAVKAVERFQAALGSKSGARFMGSIESGMQKIVNLADKFTQKDMESGLDMAAGAVTTLTDGVVKAVTAVFRLKSSFDGAFGEGASFRHAGRILSTMAAPLSIAAGLANALAAAFDAVAGAAGRAAAAANSISGNTPSGAASRSSAAKGAGIGGVIGGVPGALVGAGYGLLTARAGGGPVSAGQGYMVGERGPEYFQPRQSGSIVPNNELGRVTRAGEGIGRAVMSSNSVDNRKSFAPNVYVTTGNEDVGNDVVAQLRHLVAGYA